MTKSIVVIKDEKDKFKVLVCFVQRGINFSSPNMANREATRLGVLEHIPDVHLIEEDATA